MSIPRHDDYYYQFGPFLVDVSNRLLLRDGAPVALPPKVFDALYVLIENSGRVLEKGDLMNHLWPDSFVEEGNLTQTIFQLRKALGESASNQQYIETIPRRGYRFIGEIKVINGEDGGGFAKQFSGMTENFQIQNAYRDDVEDEDGVDRQPETGDRQPIDVNEAVVFDHRQQELVSLVSHRRQHVSFEAAKKSGKWIRLRYAAVTLLTVIVIVAGLYVLNQRTPLIGRADAPFNKIPQIRKLTTSGNAQLPSLSPNGNYVAYVLNDDGRQSVRVRHVNSTSEVQVVPPAAVTYRGITFSPDGSFIYYVVLEKDQVNGTLYQAPVLGGNTRKILELVDSAITFSPDGNHFAFVRTNDEQQETSLICANADGSE
ncbi:MAG: winged helix-turn-helix domain-containing protein, partial [Blastocatellia bacterium]|nr:winged helix-turn-helix domain-containing protein [Blastocatellia bacterium]